MKTRFCVLICSFLLSLGLNSVALDSFLARIKQQNAYLRVKNGILTTTNNADKASIFTIIDQTPTNLRGATHHFIQVPDSENYINVENDQLLIGTEDGKKSRWIRILRNKEETVLKNQNIRLQYIR